MHFSAIRIQFLLIFCKLKVCVLTLSTWTAEDIIASTNSLENWYPQVNEKSDFKRRQALILVTPWNFAQFSKNILKPSVQASFHHWNEGYYWRSVLEVNSNSLERGPILFLGSLMHGLVKPRMAVAIAVIKFPFQEWLSYSMKQAEVKFLVSY